MEIFPVFSVILDKSLYASASVHLPSRQGKNGPFHFAILWEKKVRLLGNSLKSWNSHFIFIGFYSPDQFYFSFCVFDSSLFCKHSYSQHWDLIMGFFFIVVSQEKISLKSCVCVCVCVSSISWKQRLPQSRVIPKIHK